MIVDTTSTKLELENGQVSASLLSDAGPEIRNECKTLKELRVGEIAETSGYKLPCKRVYHGAARLWDSKLSAECIKVCTQSTVDIFHWCVTVTACCKVGA